jgi:hypothetical protein
MPGGTAKGVHMRGILGRRPRPDGDEPGDGQRALTADAVRSVRFHISEPQGYFFPQVEEFVSQVAGALAEHERRAFADAQAKHDLQVELDRQAHDAQRLRTEIELFRVQGNPLVNEDGSYRTETQVAAEQEMHRQNVTLRNDIAALQADLTACQQELERARERQDGGNLPPQPSAAAALPSAAPTPPSPTAVVSGQPAAPGSPLATAGVPLEVWAPELSQ